MPAALVGRSSQKCQTIVYEDVTTPWQPKFNLASSSCAVSGSILAAQSMKSFKVRLLNGAAAVLVADEKPLYLNTGADFYTVEDLIDGEKPYLQEGHGESIQPVMDWNNAVELAAAKRVHGA